MLSVMGVFGGRSLAIAAGGIQGVKSHRGGAAMSRSIVVTAAGMEGPSASQDMGNREEREAGAAAAIWQKMYKSLDTDDQAIADGILAELDPQSVVEMVLARQIILSTLRLGRVAGAEK